jgi:predicted phage terminase large subunit-like protein
MQSSQLKPSQNDIREVLTLEPMLARNFLIHFVLYTFPQYSIQWFNKLLCEKLDKLYSGEIRRLMIFVPPQHGKTELVSRRFPAYVLGRNPDTKIAVCSYSSDLAAKINRQVQRIIDDPFYKTLFPKTTLNVKHVVTDAKQNYVRNSDEFEIVGYKGGLKAVGVGGPLTGNPVDLAVIDDPVKDAMEGQSSTDRNRKWEWYCDVLSTRLHNESKVLVTMTRWHEDDLAGRILAKESGWEVVVLPYIKEEYTYPGDARKVGDALWPDKHSVKKAAIMRANSERTFVSLMQQRPAPAEGGLFKRTWWRYWKQLPQRIDRLILVMDCTFKGISTSDYVVAGIFAKSGTDTCFVDMIRGKWDFPETINQLKTFLRRYPYVQEKYIEDKANGQAVIDTLKKEIVGLIPITPHESKESRAYSISNIVESGHVYLPENTNWKDIALMELSVFPNGVNDDIVDIVVYALMKLYSQSQTIAMNIKI